MYKTIKLDNITTLYKVRQSDGAMFTIARVIDTFKGKVLIIKDYTRNAYRFKSIDGVQFKRCGSDCIASVTSDIKVLKVPHYATLHNEIIKANRLRYYLGSNASDNIALDTLAICNNMLDCIATL